MAGLVSVQWGLISLETDDVGPYHVLAAHIHFYLGAYLDLCPFLGDVVCVIIAELKMNLIYSR